MSDPSLNPSNAYTSGGYHQRSKTSYSYTTSRRSNRNTKKIVDEFYTIIRQCHHCEKSFSDSDLYKCSKTECSIDFCFLCLKKYFLAMSKKSFERECKREHLCLVCQGMCLCTKCQTQAIEDDLNTMCSLVERSSKQNFKIEEEKDSTREYCEQRQEAPKMSTFVENSFKKNSEDTGKSSVCHSLNIPKLGAGSYSIFDLATAQQQQKMNKMLGREENYYGLHI